MAEEEPAGSLVDWDRCGYLGDVGLPGYVVAWCVTAGGDDLAWIVDESALLDSESTSNGDAYQPHEQLGPLPALWRHRVALAPYRCGRPRADGRPCRQAVRAPGRTCGWHAERASAP